MMALEQGEKIAAADAEYAKALQGDSTFWEGHEALDQFEYFPLWQTICAFRGMNPAHRALSSPDYAARLERHISGEVAACLKDLVRLHGKALGHAKAGGLKGFGETTKDFKTTVHDLTKWAEDVGEVALESAKQAPPEALIKPLSRGQAQENVILKTLGKMGYNPLQLPVNPKGKPGVKAEVRKALKGNKLFTGSTVFEHAWERVTANGDIVIAKVSP